MGQSSTNAHEKEGSTLEADLRSQDAIDLQLSLDVMASKLDDVHKALTQEASAAPVTAMTQGLQVIDAKLTALDHVVRQLFRQAKQTPPKRTLGVWHMIGVLLLVGMVGVGVGAGIGWRLTPVIDAALIKYTTKAILEELQTNGAKGKR